MDTNALQTETGQAALHDAYATHYDDQIAGYGCYLAEALFGLCFEFVQPGQRLLDLGIGSGLAAAPFGKAGLLIFGMDFSAAMLDLCHDKGIATELRRHDLQNFPWPYDDEAFDHVICCGVMHFMAELDALFVEATRILRPGGLFAYTIKQPKHQEASRRVYERKFSGGLDVFAHSTAYVTDLIASNRLERLKMMRCFVSDDIFSAYVCRKPRSDS